MLTMPLGTSVQEAINICVGTNEIVEMTCFDSNEDIKKAISDYKGCEAMKCNEHSTKIIIFPPLPEADKDHCDQV